MTPATLRAARKRLGLSQSAMAEALGISRAWYIELEMGRAEIRRLHVLAVEALLARQS